MIIIILWLYDSTLLREKADRTHKCTHTSHIPFHTQISYHTYSTPTQSHPCTYVSSNRTFSYSQSSSSLSKNHKIHVIHGFKKKGTAKICVITYGYVLYITLYYLQTRTSDADFSKRVKNWFTLCNFNTVHTVYDHIFTMMQVGL